MLSRSELFHFLICSIGQSCPNKCVHFLICPIGQSCQSCPNNCVLCRKVGRSLLEKVDRYLWSRQPVAISPQLQEIEEREREKRHNGQETGLV